MLLCCLLCSLFYGSHCVRVLCWVLGLWCLKRWLCCHVVCCRYCFFYFFNVLLLCLSISFGPRIEVFEAVIMLSCCLLCSLFYGCHCVRVLCLVLGLWCLKRWLCCHVVCCRYCCFLYCYMCSHCVRVLCLVLGCGIWSGDSVVMLFVVLIVLCALIALMYCVGSSDCGVWSGDSVVMLFVVFSLCYVL